MRLRGPGYAVVDVGTTGLYPGGHDRVVEIAIVQLDACGQVEFEWCTLMNPQRDLGPQAIHGVSASDLWHAPTFAEVAHDVALLLRGRVFVAHNASFDSRFVDAEFARAGWTVTPGARDFVCTMQLASHYLPQAGRSLAICCECAGVDHDGAHSALGDARAAAALFGYYMGLVAPPPPWSDAQARAQEMRLIDATLSACTVARGAAESRAPWTARLADRLPRSASEPHIDSYLALLDDVLLDRVVVLSEQEALVELASIWGIDRRTVDEVRQQYLRAVAVAAWADGVITDAERADLRSVAHALLLTDADVDVALRAAQHDDAAGRPVFTLQPGDEVVFTGEMERSREEWEGLAEHVGLTPWKSVTKRTRLLVAADPDSQSGKPRTARRYGIPVVTEAAVSQVLASVPVA